MSFPNLEKAKILLLDRESNEPTGEPMVLDFNPETLSMEVSNALDQRSRGRARQTVKETVSTLSFDALFDSTRPNHNVESAEDLDVRRRTQRLVALLDVGEHSRGERQPRPARVRFVWGSVVFDGVFSKFSETLEYFSPEGIPLRSRVSIELTEQLYQYQIEEMQRARLREATGDGGEGGDGASQDEDSPEAEDDLQEDPEDADRPGFGGLSLPGSLQFAGGASAGFEAQISLGMEAGVSLGFEAQLEAEVGVGVDASLALDVFGAELAAQAGASAAARAMASVSASADTQDGRSTRWAPDGVRPGTAAAAIAAQVIQNRHRPSEQSFVGVDESPQLQVARQVRPTPIKGSAPTLITVVGQPETSVYGDHPARGARPRRGPSPRWEAVEARSRTHQETDRCCPKSSTHRRGGCCGDD